MNLFEHSIRIPGPLRAIEMPPLEVARRIVRYHDNPHLLKEFRLVVQLHDGKWYLNNREPFERSAKDGVVTVQFALKAMGSLSVLHYGFLDEDMTCLKVEETYITLLLDHQLRPRYELAP